MKILCGHDEKIAVWVAERIPHVGPEGFGPAVAVGVVNEDETHLLAGVVFHDYQPSCGTVQLSCVAATPKWATRNVIRAILHIPFVQYGLFKVWTATPQDNKRALKFNRGIGFRQEATLRHQFGPKRHAIICSMTRPEYLKEFDDGQVLAVRTAAA